ncbi:MAG: hypothetical protein PHU12_02410 [Candidatus Aenigmarchaeota archaeon]|nr:hypothetical protein [Candidatus Aenigmarchaeota archaeon]
MNLLRGDTRKKKLEDASFKTVITSSMMIFLGLLLGSFVKYAVYLATIGAFILLVGIILYIISQLGE